MRKSITREISSLEESIKNSQERISMIQNLQKLYPDLEIYSSCLGVDQKITYTFTSKFAAKDCNKFEQKRQHDCDISPYVETPYGNVYTDVLTFFPANRDYNAFKMVAWIVKENWQKEFVDAGLSQNLIDQVQTFFDKNAKKIAKAKKEYEQKLAQSKELEAKAQVIYDQAKELYLQSKNLMKEYKDA